MQIGFVGLGKMGLNMVTRLARGGLRALAPFINRPNAPDFADLNWRRLTTLRQALAHAAEALGPDAIAPDDVRITHRAGEASLTWLPGGWLSSRLRDDSHAGVRLHIEEIPRGDEMLTLSFGALTASMNQGRASIEAAGRPPVRLAVRQESDADAVVAELGNLSHDVGLRDALGALVRHFRLG